MSLLSASIAQITVRSFWNDPPVVQKRIGQEELDHTRETLVIDLLKASGKPMTRPEISEAAGMSLSTFDRTMRRLESAQRVTRHGKQAVGRAWSAT